MMRLPLAMLLAVTATFTSWLGFEVAVPEGWSAYQMGEHVAIRRLEAGQSDGFLVRLCPDAKPQLCLSEPEMAVQLLHSEPAKLGQYPGTAYTYQMQTAAGTRKWLEVITLATVQGKTYAVDVMIPSHEVGPEYRRLYDEIRGSFRLVRQ